MFNFLSNKKILALIVGCIYFILLLVSMPDYNIFWDARNHYFKGQAFVSFFLSGRKDYEGLPITKDYARYHRDYVSKYSPDPNIASRISKDPNYRRSIYQDDVHTFDWLMKSNQIEHPVFSDIASTFSNVLFYEKLGWLRDDYSYRIYTLSLASILVTVIFYWLFSLYGFIAAIIGTLTLATTPLFWAESHFNLKDIPQMTFFALAIWQFYNGIVSKSKKKIIFSAIFAACAFSTKLNIVFLPFILAPWFIIFYLKEKEEERSKYHSWWWLLLAYPAIMFGIFIAVWPQMWQTPVKSFLDVIEIYRQIGVAPDYTPTFRTIFGFSTYAAIWIFLTTYPWVGILSIFGIAAAILNFKKVKNYLPFLLLLWLFVPIARASLPFTSIFGGVRHIMEYIPALAMLVGYGTYNLLKFFPSRLKGIIGLILILGFIPLILTLVKLHPAENVYFNSLIGGLSGAKKANITGWGYNDGGIYRKATVWLNEHAEKGSHVAVTFSEPADFYIPELRDDLLADNSFSGYLQKGEYIIGLTHDTGLDHVYRVKYSEDFLEPLYLFSIDNVPLLKIWKNEKKYLKKDFSKLDFKNLSIMPEKLEDILQWKLDSEKIIMGIEVSFDENGSCKKLTNAYFQVSEDGENWEILPDIYPGGTLSFLGDQPKDGKLVAPIVGVKIQYVSLVIDPQDSCIFNLKNSEIVVLE
ncbi:MAG: glycosyltransferase family 39 protein [Candidatus Levybacteria bacterium]|nr:glycosyltransferase family 39 protein [Candidatus Levybacteria bacterium]